MLQAQKLSFSNSYLSNNELNSISTRNGLLILTSGSFFLKMNGRFSGNQWNFMPHEIIRMEDLGSLSLKLPNQIVLWWGNYTAIIKNKAWRSVIDSFEVTVVVSDNCLLLTSSLEDKRTMETMIQKWLEEHWLCNQVWMINHSMHTSNFHQALLLRWYLLS